MMRSVSVKEQGQGQTFIRSFFAKGDRNIWFKRKRWVGVGFELGIPTVFGSD